MTNDNNNQPLTSGSFEAVPSLKDLSLHQFAALGGQDVVFVRKIDAKKLTEFVPEAEEVPPAAEYHLVMAADGSPLMVTDNEISVSDWLSENEVELAEVH